MNKQEREEAAGRIAVLLLSMGCTDSDVEYLNPFLSEDSDDAAIRLESFLGTRLRRRVADMTPHEIVLAIEGAALADRVTACPACGRRSGVA